MENNKEGQQVVDSYVTPFVISTVGILFTLLILASFFFIFWWHYLRPHRTTNHNTTMSLTKISNGVPEEILNKIPIIIYSSQENNNEAFRSECSICLGQFEDEEKLRVLPSCRHNFHVPCIDAWFKEHTDCPFCRSPIIPSSDDLESSSALPADSSENGAQQMALHAIPLDRLTDDGDLSADHSRFQQPHTLLHTHSHSVSCHHVIKKKPRSLGMRLKRSFSMDQSSLYIAVTTQRDHEEAASASSSFSSYSNFTKGLVMSRYKSESLRRVLMRSFSQFRNSGILPN